MRPASIRSDDHERVGYGAEVAVNHKSGVHFFPDSDPSERIREYFHSDPELAEARDELEATIARLVPGTTAQWDLFEHILTRYEPAVFTACLAAVAREFPDRMPPNE